MALTGRPPPLAPPANCTSLLWFLHLYDQAGNDHRFSPILCTCRHLLPRDNPATLPHLIPAAPARPPSSTPAQSTRY